MSNYITIKAAIFTLNYRLKILELCKLVISLFRKLTCKTSVNQTLIYTKFNYISPRNQMLFFKFNLELLTIILDNRLNLQKILINFLTILSFNLCSIQLAISIELLESTNPSSIYQNNTVLFNQEEELIGTIFRRSLISTENFENNLLINEYLNNLGRSLLIYTKQNTLQPLHFFVINSNDLNACTFMGGNIGIFAGMINFSENESELAAILAHEIGHITQRHFTREAAYQQRLLPITVIEAIAATALGVPDLIMPIIGGHLQQSLSFSRKQEQEADHVGINLLYNSKFNPIAMPDIFTRMSKQQAISERLTEFGSTHPIFSNRITEAYNRIPRQKYQQYQNSMDYQLIKVINEINLSANKREILEKIQNSLSITLSSQQQPYFLYKQALLLKSLHKYDKAAIILTKLCEQYPDNFLLQNSLAEILIYTNKNLALEKLSCLYSLVPEKLSILINYSKALFNANLYQQAKEILAPTSRDHLSQLLEEPKIYQLMIACCQKLGLEAESMWHQAKLLIVTNQLDAGKDKLLLAAKIAKKQPDKNLQNKITVLQQELEEFILRIKNI